MQSLEPIFNHVPAWLLVMFRLTGLFIIGPFFSSVAIFPRVKVFLAMTLSLCIYPMLLASDGPASAHVGKVVAEGVTLWTLMPMVGSEILIGAVIGYIAMLPLMALQVGGHVIDQQIGLGLAGLINPGFDEMTGVVGAFYYVGAMAIFLVMGGHRVLLATLVGSYDEVPLGGFMIDGHVAAMIVGVLGTAFELAMRVAAPLLCLVFLETVAMGFIARTVPQMNILSIGFPLRIVVGAFILIATAGVVLTVQWDVMERTLEMLMRHFGM